MAAIPQNKQVSLSADVEFLMDETKKQTPA